MTSLDSFFTPFDCKSLHLSNRFLMAPMSRYFAPGGVLTQESADYYRRRIEGGVAAVITEGVAVDRPGSVAADTVPCFYGEEGLAANLRRFQTHLSSHSASVAFVVRSSSCKRPTSA